MKSSSLPIDGFVFGGPRFNSSILCNGKLVSLPPYHLGFNKFLFNKQRRRSVLKHGGGGGVHKVKHICLVYSYFPKCLLRGSFAQ